MNHQSGLTAQQSTPRIDTTQAQTFSRACNNYLFLSSAVNIVIQNPTFSIDSLNKLSNQLHCCKPACLETNTSTEVMFKADIRNKSAIKHEAIPLRFCVATINRINLVAR